MQQLFRRASLLVGVVALISPLMPAGGVAVAAVTAQGKAVPVVTASCTLPGDAITGSGRYDSLRTGAIQGISVSVENTTKDSRAVDAVTVSVTYSERTSGNFVFSIPPDLVSYEPGDTVRSYVFIFGRRDKVLAAYGYVTCS